MLAPVSPLARELATFDRAPMVRGRSVFCRLDSDDEGAWLDFGDEGGAVPGDVSVELISIFAVERCHPEILRAHTPRHNTAALPPPGALSAAEVQAAGHGSFRRP